MMTPAQATAVASRCEALGAAGVRIVPDSFANCRVYARFDGDERHFDTVDEFAAFARGRG